MGPKRGRGNGPKKSKNDLPDTHGTAPPGPMGMAGPMTGPTTDSVPVANESRDGSKEGKDNNASTRQDKKKRNTSRDTDISLPDSELLDKRDAFDAKRATIQQKAGEAPIDKRLEVHCIKTEFVRGTEDDSGVALTNHFEVTLPEKVLYEYRIEGFITQQEIHDDNKPSRDRRKEFKEKAIEGFDILSKQKNHFVADDFDLVVAWKDLSTYAGQSPALPGNIFQEYKICLREPRNDDDTGDYRQLALRYNGQVPIQSFLDLCHGDIQGFPIRRVDGNGEAATLAVEHAMNLILAESTKLSGTAAFRMGSKKMYLGEAKVENIVTGVNLHEGYYSTVKLGMGKPLLNISTTASVFWREMPLREYLTGRGCKKSIPRHIQNSLKGVKVRVQYLNGRAKTIKAFGRATPSTQSFQKAIDWTKGEDGKRKGSRFKQVTVYENLAEKKDSGLDASRLKAIRDSPFHCINIGSTNRGKEEWYPIEELIIVGEQLYRGKLTADAKGKMITEARCSPGEARKRICGPALELLGIPKQNDPDSILNKASLSVLPKMLEVPTRGIELPSVEIRKQQGNQSSWEINKAVFSKGKWNWKDSQFFDTKNKMKGPIVLLISEKIRTLDYTMKENTKGKSKTDDQQLQADVGVEYAKALVESLESLGIAFEISSAAEKYCVVNIDLDPKKDLASEFDKGLVTAKGLGAGLVVLVNAKKGDTDAFDEFRRAADQRYGIHALCMTDEAARHALRNKLSNGSSTLTGHMANIAMKVNVKLGNTNHATRESFEGIEGLRSKLYTSDNLLDTIILGADLVHANRESELGTPSLAAVVGSVDGDFANYLGSMRAQEFAPMGTEPIDCLDDMIIERLRAWSEHNKYNGPNSIPRLPKRVLYYRDGVGDGQYVEIRQREITQIGNAYNKISAEYQQKGWIVSPIKPEITAVIVTKRHHTRFFPKQTSSLTNCPPGTVVDSGVTSPCYFDFFLQSHSVPQGTARPTYYFVLENGIDLSPRQLQDFTNLLCYTYVRATLPVGYVPPTYYADRLCDRARCYMRDAYVALKKTLKEDAKKDKKVKKGLPKPKLDGTPTSSVASDMSDTASQAPQEDGRFSDSDDDEDQGEVQKWKTKGWFDRYNANGGSEENSVGPWHKNLNNSMFWM